MRVRAPRDPEGYHVLEAPCEKVIEAHGGSVGAESAPGEGAAFWFTLPRR